MSDAVGEGTEFHVERGSPEGPALPPSGAMSQDLVSGNSDYQTLANGHLTPRHRRFCQLAAEGRSNKEIATELGYVDSRVSVLLKNPFIAQEISRLQDRIFEETIAQRLRSFSEPALANIHWILTDRTNKVKVSEKADMSKWLVEKLDGKAVQKTDVGENLLSVLMDRLDARRMSAPPLAPQQITQNNIHIYPSSSPEGGGASPKEVNPDLLEAWVDDFDSPGK